MICSKIFNFRAKTVMGPITSCDMHVNATFNLPHTRHPGQSQQSTPFYNTVCWHSSCHTTIRSHYIWLPSSFFHKISQLNHAACNCTLPVSIAFQFWHQSCVKFFHLCPFGNIIRNPHITPRFDMDTIIFSASRPLLAFPLWQLFFHVPFPPSAWQCLQSEIMTNLDDLLV